MKGIGTEKRGASCRPWAASVRSATRSTMALASSDQPRYTLLSASPSTSAFCAEGRQLRINATRQPNNSGSVYSGSMMNRLAHIAGDGGKGHQSWVP